MSMTKFVSFFFFFTSISLCLTPPPPPPPPSRQEKERKKENNSYALYLLNKIICDRGFFPFFTCITYWIDRLPTTSFYCYVLPKPFRVFFPCEAFLIFKSHWIHECASKRKNAMDSSLRRTYRRFIVQMVYFNSRKNVQKMYKN